MLAGVLSTGVCDASDVTTITVPDRFFDDHREYAYWLYRTEPASGNTMGVRAGLTAAVGAVTGR
jgi:hypothetical protein